MKLDWWTLGLQTINVIVLLWVLQRFLFKPVLAVIARRQQATQQLMDDAAAAKQAAEQAREAFEAKRDELASGREQALAAAQAEATKARDELLAQATAEAQQRRAAGEAVLQRERDDAAADLRTKASTLAGDLARRLLTRLPDASWNRHFIEGACSQLAALAEAERAMLRASDADTPVQVISADALDADDRTQLREALGAAMGREVPVEFSTDENLLAGVELRFRHLVIRNHWAADLDQLVERIQHDDDPARAS